MKLNVLSPGTRTGLRLQKLIRSAAKEHAVMISIEEGSIGGFAAHVMQFLALDGGWGFLGEGGMLGWGSFVGGLLWQTCSAAPG